MMAVEPANPNKVYCAKMIQKWQFIIKADPSRTAEGNAEIDRLRNLMLTAPNGPIFAPPPEV